MEGQILEAIYHVKSIKRNLSIKISSHTEKSTASNNNLEVIEETVSNMVANKFIDKDFRILKESCNLFTLAEILDHIITLKLFIKKREAKVFKNQLMNQ